MSQNQFQMIKLIIKSQLIKQYIEMTVIDYQLYQFNLQQKRPMNKFYVCHYNRIYGQILLYMFKLNTIDPTNLQTNFKVYKIRSILSKALAECKHRVSQPSIDLVLTNKIESKTQAQSIQEVYENLKKGHLVQKHSRNTNQSHIKLVYLSKDQKWLCWKSIYREDQKRIALGSIVKIVKEGHKNYIRSNLSLKNPTCCIIVVSTVRNLELEATSEFQADLLRYQLIRALKHSQEMSQNYPYHRK